MKTVYFSSILIFCIALAQSLLAELQLTDFNISNSVWVGSEEIEIKYDKQKKIALSSSNYIKIHITDKQWVSKGTLIATIDPIKLNLERRSYKLHQQQIKLQRDELLEDIEDQETTKASELLKIEQTIQKLKVLAKEDLSKNNRERVNIALEKAYTEIATLEKKLSKKKGELKLSIYDEEQSIRLEGKLADLKALELRSQIKAPFDCQLHYISPELEHQKLVWIEEPGEIFSMIDPNNIILTCQPKSYKLTQLDPKEIFLSLGTQSGNISAKFIEQQTITKNIRRFLIWRFNAEISDNDSLSNIIGTSQLGNLFLKLPEKVHLVPKTKLVTLYPSILEKHGWKGVIQELWPNSKIIYIAPRFIAIQP